MLLSMTLSTIQGTAHRLQPYYTTHIDSNRISKVTNLTIAFPFLVSIWPPMYYITVVASIENQILLSNHLQIQIRQEAQVDYIEVYTVYATVREKKGKMCKHVG
jgi:hypothetical protein